MTPRRRTTSMRAAARRQARRGHPAALAVAGVVLVGGLVACGPADPGATTCGELQAMSPEQRRDVVRAGISEQGTDEDRSAAEAGGDAALDAGADALVGLCSIQGADTPLSDLQR